MRINITLSHFGNINFNKIKCKIASSEKIIIQNKSSITMNKENKLLFKGTNEKNDVATTYELDEC